MTEEYTKEDFEVLRNDYFAEVKVNGELNEKIDFLEKQISHFRDELSMTREKYYELSQRFEESHSLTQTFQRVLEHFIDNT